MRKCKELCQNHMEIAVLAMFRLQLQRDESICTVYGRQTSVHMVSKPLYRVYCVVDESHLEIVYAYCLDFKASECGCEHAGEIISQIRQVRLDRRFLIYYHGMPICGEGCCPSEDAFRHL